MTMTRVRVRWYETPERPCAGLLAYADLTLVHSPGRREQIMAMQTACAGCPVYYDCLDDLLTHPLWEHYGVRAGIRGKA